MVTLTGLVNFGQPGGPGVVSFLWVIVYTVQKKGDKMPMTSKAQAIATKATNAAQNIKAAAAALPENMQHVAAGIAKALFDEGMSAAKKIADIENSIDSKEYSDAESIAKQARELADNFTKSADDTDSSVNNSILCIATSIENSDFDNKSKTLSVLGRISFDENNFKSFLISEMAPPFFLVILHESSEVAKSIIDNTECLAQSILSSTVDEDIAPT